jgi:hypothetical protein
MITEHVRNMNKITCINMHIKYLHVSWISFHLQTLPEKLSGYKSHWFDVIQK